MRTQPHRRQHRSIAERHRRHARPAVTGRRRLDRCVRPVEVLVALLLPAVCRNALVEVALRIHEPDADQRHAEVRRFLAVIAGQHAKTAGVDRQRLMQRELGRKVGDDLVRHAAGTAPSTRCSAPSGRHRAPRSPVRRAGGSPGPPQRPRAWLARDQRQHADWIVRGGTPQRVVEAAEHLARFCMPGPPEIDRKLIESGDGSGKSGKARIAFHLCLSIRSDRGWRTAIRSILPPDTTATILPAAGASAERRGDGAARRAFGDDVRPLGDQMHRARGLVQRHDDRSGERRQQRPHRLQDRLAAGAVDERWPSSRRSSIGRPAASDAASGAAVSGSAAKTFACRASARDTAAAMPDSSPPPPSGATIASTSGRSSRISSAAVPFPAMNRSSSNGCTK